MPVEYECIRLEPADNGGFILRFDEINVMKAGNGKNPYEMPSRRCESKTEVYSKSADAVKRMMELAKNSEGENDSDETEEE